MSLHELLLAPFLDYGFMRRALVATLALAMGCGPIGVVLVLRRMSLTGDALAHAILPGAAIGFLLAGLSLLTIQVALAADTPAHAACEAKAVDKNGKALAGAASRAVQAGHVGLAMVRRRVEDAGGRLHLATRTDGGTHSRIVMPVPIVLT